MTNWLSKKEASDLIGNLEITKLSHEQKMEVISSLLALVFTDMIFQSSLSRF